MLNLLALCCLPTAPHPRVIAASVFKNGYAFLVREIHVQGTGEVTLTDLPHPSLGTFWISATDGIRIEDVVRRQKPADGKSKSTASSITEILSLNIGKTLRLIVSDPTGAKSIEGKLVANSGELVILQTNDGTVAFPRNEVYSVAAAGSALQYEQSYPNPSVDTVDLRVKADKPGKIYLVGVEPGMTWTPEYSLDISDKKALHLTAKATLVNNLDDLNAVDTQFVSGFPNLPMLGLDDPFFGSQLMNPQWFSGANRDMNFQAAKVAAPAPPALDEASAFAAPTQGTANEDLYFYKHVNLTLKKGERGYYILLEFTAPYSDLYTLDLANTVAENTNYQLPTGAPDVWHTIRFKDQTKEPLTTGAATVFRNGQVLGQDTLTWTSAGASGDVRMAKALDIHADQGETELSRDRGALHLWNGVQLDLVTVQGTIELNSFKNEPVKLQVTKSFTGELVSADNGAISSKVAKNLQETNPHGEIKWSLDLGAGEKKTLTYSYKLYVRPS